MHVDTCKCEDFHTCVYAQMENFYIDSCHCRHLDFWKNEQEDFHTVLAH
jgi:hypothetical protein